MTLKSSTFATFPEFSKLTIADKEVYESHIQKYPPLSDISFAGLMTWWNFLDSCAVSVLNGNLVISYWFPGDEKSSGLSLIGTEKVDESICAIFDHLVERGEPARLVHVSEIVMSQMKYPDMFQFIAEQDYDECVYAVSSFYPLPNATPRVCRGVKLFLDRVEEESVVMRSLDLSSADNQKLLLRKDQQWFRKGGFNDIAEIDREALEVAITHAAKFDTKNICFYINGELAGFQLYQLPTDRRYVIATFVKVDTTIPGMTEYVFYACAKWYAERGISMINFEQDLGVPHLRAEKLAMGPVNFFRKYTVTPRTSKREV